MLNTARKTKRQAGNVLANYRDIAFRCSSLQTSSLSLCTSGYHRENGERNPDSLCGTSFQGGFLPRKLCVNSALSSFLCKMGSNPDPGVAVRMALGQEPLQKDGCGFVVAVLLELLRQFQVATL